MLHVTNGDSNVETMRRALLWFEHDLELTALGAEVLAGRADRVALIGFDRRLGGMHLRAGNGLWRWDAVRGALLAP